MGRPVESYLPVKFRWLMLLLLLGIAPPLTVFAMDCPLLVVAAQSAPVDHLTREDVRRIYLGVPYQVGGHTLHPIRNTSSTILQEVFLQKILAMSKNAYRRVLASRLVRLREPGPAEIDDTRQLVRILVNNPYLVSYLWKSDMPGHKQLKILLEVPCESH